MQELLLIGVLCLLIFGPDKMTSMARDAGRFVSQARSSIEDFKSEIEPEDDFEDEELEDLEEDEETEWLDQEEQENSHATSEEHMGNYDQQSPVLEQNSNEEHKDVSLEK